MLTATVRSIVLLAPLVGLLATVVLTAAERAAEIPPIRVPRMCQKANSTVAAVDRTACQIGTIAQDGIQRDLILTNKRTSAIVLMPIRAKRENLAGSYDKNARFSVKILILLYMSSSYELDANASRGRAGIFSCPHAKTRAENVHNRSTRYKVPATAAWLLGTRSSIWGTQLGICGELG
jgi:hypothetical protein